MSEEAKKEAAPAAPVKTHFLEKPAIRGLLTVMALFSPGPLMLTMANLWLGCCAPAELAKSDPFTLFRQALDGTGAAPAWLPALAFAVPVIFLVVLHRKSMPVLLVLLLALVGAAVSEAFLLQQITQN